MAHLRIRCRGPEKMPGSRSFPTIQRLPDFVDTEVLIVREDGTEEPLDGVMAVAWSVSAEAQIPVAVIEVHGVGIDVDAKLPGEQPPCPTSPTS